MTELQEIKYSINKVISLRRHTLLGFNIPAMGLDSGCGKFLVLASSWSGAKPSITDQVAAAGYFYSLVSAKADYLRDAEFLDYFLAQTKSLLFGSSAGVYMEALPKMIPADVSLLMYVGYDESGRRSLAALASGAAMGGQFVEALRVYLLHTASEAPNPLETFSRMSGAIRRAVSCEIKK